MHERRFKDGEMTCLKGTLVLFSEKCVLPKNNILMHLDSKRFRNLYWKKTKILCKKIFFCSGCILTFCPKLLTETWEISVAQNEQEAKKEKRDLQGLLIATKNVSSVWIYLWPALKRWKRSSQKLSQERLGAAGLRSLCRDPIWHGSVPALAAARRTLTAPLEQISVDAEAHRRDLLPPRT